MSLLQSNIASSNISAAEQQPSINCHQVSVFNTGDEDHEDELLAS